ncbi:unnamed protein product, partial [Candidula unifasciata]
MASSSVSQESLDMDDMDTTARRNRIRIHRGHSGRGSMPHRGPTDRGDGGELDRDDRGDYGPDVGDGSSTTGVGLVTQSHSHLPGDHESPTRGAAARLKDKRSRPNHMKGKLPKDKRKLREKRRSTGVVHCIPSTESTGDSLDDDDDDTEDAGHDTKKNTVYNEGTVPGHHPKPAYEGRHSSNPIFSHPRRNKSPSDLEADLEDNQDYDSTVSHSETNLTLIGRSESSDIAENMPGRQQPGIGTGVSGRVNTGSFSSKYSPESSRLLKFNAGNISSDADSSRTNTPSTSSSSSLLSRSRDIESPRSAAGVTTSTAAEADLSRRFNATNTTSTTVETNQGTQPAQARPLGFSVFNNSNVLGARCEKPSYSSYVSSASRFRDRDSGSSSNSIHSRLATYQTPRPFISTSAAPVTQQNEAIAQLEK